MTLGEWCNPDCIYVLMAEIALVLVGGVIVIELLSWAARAVIRALTSS